VNALLRDLVKRLHEYGVETIYHGDLTGVLGEYWSVEANLESPNLLGTSAVSRSTRERLRGVPHWGGLTLRSVDLPDASGVRGARADASASRDVDLPVWFRGPRRSRRVADAARTGNAHSGQADGTARAVPVGRPPVVPRRGGRGGSQRIAHRPARCRRGVTVTPASGRSVSAGWMSMRWSLAFQIRQPVVQNGSQGLTRRISV
jgi:hypothetical protein